MALPRPSSRSCLAMALQTIHTDFEEALLEPTRVFEELATAKTFNSTTDFTTDDPCLLEGILSRIWQTWCRFCRSLLIESCRGTQDVSGLPIAGLHQAISDDHVSGAAIQAGKRRAVTWNVNSLLRREPTWGDVDVLFDIANGLNPANKQTIVGMCTMASPSAKPLQAARNAAAHHNRQSLGELSRHSSAYGTFPITHACESLFWVRTTTNSFLLPQALEELKDAAAFAVL
jgi:hypothetical protein